jgi:hypothetical protein
MGAAAKAAPVLIINMIIHNEIVPNLPITYPLYSKWTQAAEVKQL